MSLRNQNWTDLHGNPITGRVPPVLQVMNGVPPNPQQMGMIAHHYKLLTYMMKVSVIPYLVQERTLPDGTRIRMVSDYGVDTVMVWPSGGPLDEGEALPQGWRALPSKSVRGDTGWVRHNTTGELMVVAGTDDPITTPGYEGTNPHVFIAARSGNVALNSAHVAGEWYWSDHKKQQLLFAEKGVYYRQKLVNLYFDGAKVEGHAKGGGIAGAWILLVVGAKLYAVKKKSVLSAAGKPVAAVMVGDVPSWKSPEDVSPPWRFLGVRPLWRFSPDGLKAVAVEGLGRVAEVQDKHLSSSGPTTGAQFIHRLRLTANPSQERPFDLDISEEVRADSILKIQPRYEFSANKIGQDFQFLRWDATAYAKFRYVFPFGFTAKTFSWERSGDGVYLTQAEYNELVLSVRATRLEAPFPSPGSGLAPADVLNPSPGMRSYVIEPLPQPPSGPIVDNSQTFLAKFTDAQGAEHNAGIGSTETPSSHTTATVVGPGKWQTGAVGASLYVTPADPNKPPWLPVPVVGSGHVDFIRSASAGPDDLHNNWYSLRALDVGFIGRFSDTYPLVEESRPLAEVLQEAKDLVAHYADQTLPADLAAVAQHNAAADLYVQQRLGSPSTPDEAREKAAYASNNPIGLTAEPSSVIRYTESGASVLGLYADGPMSVHESNPDREAPDTTFWTRFYSRVSVAIHPRPRYNLSSTVDYTAATAWVFSGRYIVDLDYGPDGKERELALVGDETRAVRYSVALRAVDVRSGAQPSEADAQRSLSGACSYTLQLDGDVVAERVVSASDTFSGFLWTERLGDWAEFRSGPWSSIWGNLWGNSWGDNWEEQGVYDSYLGQRRGSEETGQVANTECAGSMACQVSDQAFHLLDYDLRFKHILLAQTAQTLSRTTQTTAIDAVRSTGTLNIALWDNGKLRSLGATVTTTATRNWLGAVPMLQSVLYAEAALTRPAAYLSGVKPAAYRYGVNGSTPTNITVRQYAAAVGALVVPLVEGLALGDAAHFAPTMGVLPDYEAVVQAGYADIHKPLRDIGGALTQGRVLSYGANVWLAVVSRSRTPAWLPAVSSTPLAPFSVARAKSFDKPSDAKSLGQLLPFLQTVAGADGGLALPGFVT